MKYIKLLFMSAVIAITSNCSTLNAIGTKVADGDFAVTVGIQYATAKFIYNDASPQATARKVISFAKEAKSFFGSEGESVLLEDALNLLRHKAMNQASDPADMILISALVGAISDSLREKIGSGIIDDQARSSVNAIANVITDTAGIAL